MPSARLCSALLTALALSGCGGTGDGMPSSRDAASPGATPGPVLPLHPGETPELRRLIDSHADASGIPRELVHKVIQRESDYRPAARNGPYYGLMQILPATARGMGFAGKPSDLLNADVNLRYATRYLRGAWLVADGDMDAAVMWYARGYYYEARDRCLLVETGLRDAEVARHCRA